MEIPLLNSIQNRAIRRVLVKLVSIFSYTDEMGTMAVLLYGLKNKGENTLAIDSPNAFSPLCESAMALHIVILTML